MLLFKDGLAKLLYNYAASRVEGGNGFRYDDEILTDTQGWQLLVELSASHVLDFNDTIEDEEDYTELTTNEAQRLDEAIGAIVHRHADDTVTAQLYETESELETAWEKIETNHAEPEDSEMDQSEVETNYDESSTEPLDSNLDDDFLEDDDLDYEVND